MKASGTQRAVLAELLAGAVLLERPEPRRHYLLAWGDRILCAVPCKVGDALTAAGYCRMVGAGAWRINARGRDVLAGRRTRAA